MCSLKFWVKVTRPLQCMVGAVATWAITVLSDGNNWFTATKFVAAGCIGLGILGASLFHYGAARKMYARKDWDRVDVNRPALLVITGAVVMFICNIIAFTWLPLVCFWITVFNNLAITCYARWLAKHWTTKNIIVALVCTTPVIMGWLSGHRLHPALPYLASATFFAYWTREIIKDYLDMQANNGIRVTLPLWLGPAKAHRVLYVAAGTASLTVVSLLSFSRTMVAASLLAVLFYLVATTSFIVIAYLLAFSTNVRKLPTFITCSNGLLMLSVLFLKMFST